MFDVSSKMIQQQTNIEVFHSVSIMFHLKTNKLWGSFHHFEGVEPIGLLERSAVTTLSVGDVSQSCGGFWAGKTKATAATYNVQQGYSAPRWPRTCLTLF